ncbi:protein SFI1 homolog isoform X12 [Castor canadensis]|uniref:Protein SFI1 homolog isoform X12 n=1 Tax=Castor canadensis TaxID=51338 RepID=A0AC58LK77_CASCN
MEKKAVDSRSLRDSMVKKPYSQKALPTKKSSNTSGIRRVLPRTTHPVQYVTSRTWTRQGRLRALRLRCVARKFLYLWIRMTFGRVFPSRARFYYEQKILRKVFGEWKEEWWVSHREWKLCVRADCHYRYYLYSLMFHTWKAYVRQRQEMRRKHIRAEDHDAKRKMRWAWKSWLIHVVVRRTKLEMQMTAQELRQRSMLWVWWGKWRQQLGEVRVSRALEAIAVKHRTLILQLQAWSRWQEQLLHRQREREKVVSAVRHHQQWQKHRSLKAWLEYLHARRAKTQQNEMAARFHRVTVLQIHFCDWQWAWERRQSLAAQQALVEELARKMVLRRALTHWKHFVLLCAEEAAQCQAAEEHHRLSLLHFCFRALKDNVTRAHFQRIRKNLAHLQHDTTLLRRFWSLWHYRIEQREEREKLPLLHAAWVHYRWVLRRWRQNTVARVDEARKCSEASVHYRRTLCSKVLVRWREVALVQIHCRQREAGALREARKVLDRAPTERQTLACTCLRSSPDLVSALAGLQPEGRPAEGPAGAGSPVSPPAAAAGGCDAVEDTPSGLRQEKAPAEAGHPTPGAETHPDLLLPVETTAGGQEAGAAEHSTGPVVLGVLATGKGKCASSGRSCVRGGKPLPQGVGVMAEVRPHLPPFLEAWTAWLGFVLERRRKKARLEWAVQFYHRQLLQEGATRLLRFAASLKAFRQQLQAQQQMQAVHSLHHVVRRCAEHWKQKALGQGRESRPPAPITPTRRVTFEGPLPNHDAAGAGDATLETKRRRARPQGAPGSLVLPAGEPYLLELNAARSARKQPRRPHFLLESTQSQRSPGYSPLPGQGLEKCQEWGRGIRPAGPSLPRPLLSGAPSAPGPELLLPPSSFTARGAGGLARVSAQPTATGPKLRAPPSLAGGSDPHLLLPGDFTGTRPEHGSAAAGQAELEAELEGIQQQLQRYQSTKYNLWSCQRQASSLRRWLELSQEEPRPEDQDAEQQVQKELDEVELQIQRLAQDLQAQRQPVRACITRVQALRRLCADRGAKADRQPSGRRRDQNTKLP